MPNYAIDIVFHVLKDRKMINSPVQIRAARALLGWTQAKLASASGLSELSIQSIEKSLTDPRASTLGAIERALTAAGVMFTNGDEPGVKLQTTAQFVSDLRAMAGVKGRRLESEIEALIDKFCRDRREQHFGSDVEPLINSLQQTRDVLFHATEIDPQIQDTAFRAMKARINELQDQQVKRRAKQ
jgi:transcriptional regulator with XRE-family HTH domain